MWRICSVDSGISAKWNLARSRFVEVAHELGAAQIREDQRLLDDHRRGREHGHAALAFPDHVAHAIPSARQLCREVTRAEHRLHLLERRLPFDDGLRRDLTIVVARDLLNRVEIQILIL